MIASLKGTLISIGKSDIILEVNDVGYFLNVSSKLISSLGDLGSNLFLYTDLQIKDDKIIMYGFQNFPTAPRDVHLNYMLKLKELFELPIGYQDHCDANEDSAFWLPAASVGMGINTLEKHITHDRSLKGIDHESALNPSEFIVPCPVITTRFNFYPNLFHLLFFQTS